MKSRQYEMLAAIVNELPSNIRTQVADHFARELHKRQPSFDLGAWESRTGGTIKRFIVETEEERKARVLAYAAEVLSRSSPKRSGGHSKGGERA